MNRPPIVNRAAPTLQLLLAITALMSCSRDTSAPAERWQIQAAKPTASGSSDPTVTSTNPASGPQNSTIDLRVFGSGFDNGSKVSFARNKVATNKIVTNSTTFISSTELLANITIAADADTLKYDVVVTTAEGKKGMGSELFTVDDDATTTTYLTNDSNHMLRGDGLAAYLEPSTSAFAGMSRYMDAQCGVGGKIYARPGESGDATMHSAATQARKCAAYPRKVRIGYAAVNADGSTTAEGSVTAITFMNVRQLHKAANNGNPAIYIAVGETQLRDMAFSDDGYKCGAAGTGAIAFVPVLRDGTATGADQVQVYRSGYDTWHVSTLPDEVDATTGKTIHHDKAYCKGNGKLYHMPTRFTIRSVIPLSP